MKVHRFAWLSIVAALAACGGVGGSARNQDAGVDGAEVDGQPADGGQGDAGQVDAASDDGSPGDASSPPDAAAAPVHLVISEIAVAPSAAEFIEIYNPTPNPVNLSTYYLSDNAVYHGIAAGLAWNPPTANPGTDFLVQFPKGATIAPQAAIVIATATGFEARFARCPDYILSTTPLACNSGMAAAMVAPVNGGVDATKLGTMLSDAREMVMLFAWDGASSVVRDVDYVTWGAQFDPGATRVDKTGIPGYQADTAAGSQRAATAPASGQSLERCAIETGETMTGGNGLFGHDETSEPMDTNFVVQPTPTPGVKNTCL